MQIYLSLYVGQFLAKRDSSSHIEVYCFNWERTIQRGATRVLVCITIVLVCACVHVYLCLDMLSFLLSLVYIFNLVCFFRLCKKVPKDIYLLRNYEGEISSQLVKSIKTLFCTDMDFFLDLQLLLGSDILSDK